MDNADQRPKYDYNMVDCYDYTYNYDCMMRSYIIRYMILLSYYNEWLIDWYNYDDLNIATIFVLTSYKENSGKIRKFGGP